jgi:hypothetical protein
MHARVKHSDTSAGVLLNLLVIVVIVLVLAALILPALQKASSASPHRGCMSKVRGIPAAIRAYAALWGGWTHPDPDYYIKLYGFKLSHENGWAPNGYRTSKDLLCPIDDSPRLAHGVRTSYFVCSGFLGANVMAFQQPANRIMVAREIVFPAPASWSQWRTFGCTRRFRRRFGRFVQPRRYAET